MGITQGSPCYSNICNTLSGNGGLGELQSPLSYGVAEAVFARKKDQGEVRNERAEAG